MSTLVLLLVVVDTSVWVSGILTPAGPPGRVVRACFEQRFQVVMSDFLFAELTGVLQRPRIRRRHEDRNDAADLVASLRSRARTVGTPGAVHICRDAKDDLVIETAINGGAHSLVSRDEDLTRDLELVENLRLYGIDVLTVARFLELLDTPAS